MIRFCCDGCEKDCEQSAVTRVGRLEPAYYCATCLPAWRAFEVVERARRVKVVQAFESWRLSALTKVRQTLKRVPDE